MSFPLPLLSQSNSKDVNTNVCTYKRILRTVHHGRGKQLWVSKIFSFESSVCVLTICKFNGLAQFSFNFWCCVLPEKNDKRGGEARMWREAKIVWHESWEKCYLTLRFNLGYVDFCAKILGL